MEKLQQDSASMSLDQHKQELIGALESEKVGTDGQMPTAPGDDFGALMGEMVLSSAGGTAMGVAVTVADDLASNKKSNSSSMFLNTKNKRPGSLFVGGGVNVNNKASHVTPLVPPSYGDKKAALKTATPISARGRDDLAARARVSSMSLTGSSLTGAKPAPIKGASVKASDAKAIKISEILAELSVTNRVMANPYENTKRLVNDYARGVDTAETVIQRATPDKIKNTAPKVAAQIMPQPPKGSGG